MRRPLVGESVEGAFGEASQQMVGFPHAAAAAPVEEAFAPDIRFTGHDVLLGIIKKHFQHLGLGREEVKRLGDARHGRVVDGDMQDVGKRAGCGKLAQHQGIASRRRARDLDASGRGEDVS